MSTFEISTGTALPTAPGFGDRVGVVRSGTPYALDLGIINGLYAAGGASGALQYNTGTGFGAVTLGTGLTFSAGTLSATASSYTLPAATTTVLGGVKAGTGLTVAGDGTLTVTSSGYTLPISSTTTLGGVKADGTSITVTASGVMSANTSGGVVLAVAGTDPVPLIDGTASVGTSGVAARENHVHPTDTSRAPVVGPSFTGGVNVSGGLTISSGGLSISGGETVLTGGLSIAGGLTVSSGVFTLPQWTTSTRPSTTGLAAGSEGFATDTARRETWTGTLWVNYVRTTDTFSGSAAGIVGASGGGTSNFLRADGSWTAPSASGYGSPQSITVAGAATFDTTKALIVVNCSSGVVVGTLPNGTLDGQEIEIAVWPTTQAHTIAATVNGSSVTLAANSPNVGVSLNLKWSSSQTSWIIRNYDGGYKISDLTAASVVAAGDKVGLLAAADGKDYSATFTQVKAFALSGFTATAAQLYAGSGTTGTVTPVTVGSGLTLSGTTLTSSGGGATLYSRPALSTFTSFGTTLTSSEVSGGPIILTSTTPVSGAPCGIYVSSGAAPWTVTATLGYNMTAETFLNAGILALNHTSGASGQFVRAVNTTSPPFSVQVNNWTSLTAFSATALSKNMDLGASKHRFRIVNDGTNITYLVSEDGSASTWLQFFQQTVAAAGSPDSIGVVLGPNMQTAASLTMMITVRGWETLASASPQAASALAGI